MNTVRKIVVAVFTMLLLFFTMPAAYADHTGYQHRQAETVCTGGVVLNTGNMEGSKGRQTPSGTIACTFNSENVTTVTLFGLKDGSARPFDVWFDSSAKTRVTQYATCGSGAGNWKCPLWTSPEIPAGPTTLYMFGVTNNAAVLDYLTVTEFDRTPPSVPSSLNVSAEGAVIVSWQASTDNSAGIIRYRVTETSTVQTSGVGTFNRFSMTTTTETTETSYTSTLPNTVDQEFSVTAVDESGNESAPATIAYNAPEPPPPVEPVEPTEPTDNGSVSLPFCESGNFAGDLCFQFVNHVAPPALGLTVILYAIGSIISYGRSGLR